VCSARRVIDSRHFFISIEKSRRSVDAQRVSRNVWIDGCLKRGGREEGREEGREQQRKPGGATINRTPVLRARTVLNGEPAAASSQFP